MAWRTALSAQTRYAAGVRFEMRIFPVLQPDPTTGYPPNNVRDEIPSITGYADGSSTPSPRGHCLLQGQLLGYVSGELSLRKFLAELGCTLVVTSDKDGEVLW